MSVFKTLVTFFTLTFLFSFSKEHPLYRLENDLIKGEKKALFKIARYFDSNKKIVEFLGHHILETKESEIAKRIVEENTLFTTEEFKIDTLTTRNDFITFLTRNEKKISFSRVAKAFLITPLEKRKVNVKFRELSDIKLNELHSRKNELLNLDWVQSNKIDSLVDARDPSALVTVAAVFFQERNRFNQYQFNENEFTDLLKLLTGAEIAVENEKHELTYLFDKEFYPVARLNLLIYFSKYYHHYKWDDSREAFINKVNEIILLSEEEKLFELLASESDSIALEAFIKLTTLNPQKVGELSDDYESHRMDKNSVLPTFPFRFLKQISLLTAYYRAKEIDYIRSNELQLSIIRLQENMDFKERYHLENKLVNTLTLEDISALEYRALIHEESYRLTFSTGRILDKFYSRNWPLLISSSKHLDAYLKKSKLFDQLGIVGICNNYLNKFINSSPNIITTLKQHKHSDSDVKQQISKIIELNKQRKSYTLSLNKDWIGYEGKEVMDVENTLASLLKSSLDKETIRDSITHIISQISYNQIGGVLKYLDKISFEYKWQKYSFIERDFGIPAQSIMNEQARADFLAQYTSSSEYDVYTYYLDKSGIEYKYGDGSLDYDKIYQILKYDIVTPFVGGGAGRENNMVYAVIKLLEIKFRTTLGYPSKLCNSASLYACYADERANEWMKYLEDNKLIKSHHQEPVSFSFQ